MVYARSDRGEKEEERDDVRRQYEEVSVSLAKMRSSDRMYARFHSWTQAECCCWYARPPAHTLYYRRPVSSMQLVVVLAAFAMTISRYITTTIFQTIIQLNSGSNSRELIGRHAKALPVGSGTTTKHQTGLKEKLFRP